MERLILASSSPRRKELLDILQLPFHIVQSDVNEQVDSSLTPKEVVQELAYRKAKAVANQVGNVTVIGADTIVVCKGTILGKPKSSKEAISMLKMLSGNTHTVYTGVAIVKAAKKSVFYEKTDVTFWELTSEEIEAYVNSGEPFDKAGGYGIQQLGATLVKRIHGDYFSVVGLPIAKLVRELRKFGF